MPIISSAKLNENSILNSPSVPSTQPQLDSVQVADSIKTNPWVDMSMIPRSSLMNYVEGSIWTVDYYSQVLDTSSQLSGQQATVNPVYQQYKLVKSLELRVTSPLQSSQDSTTKAMTLTGTSITQPFIIPNEGDLFIADIGQGNSAIFRVTDSIKKSIFKEAVYEISYGLNTTNNYNKADLDQKCISVVYYHKDFLLYGQNPLLIQNDHDTIIEFNKIYQQLCVQYFRRFFSDEFKTLILPAQPYSIYDKFLVDFILGTFTTDDSQEVRFIKKYSVGQDNAFKTFSIWDAIKNRDPSLLNVSFKTIGLVNASSFSEDPILEGFRYCGIEKIVYPVNTIKDVDYMLNDRSKVICDEFIIPSDINNTIVTRAFNLKNTDLNTTVLPVSADNHYVFSSNFYLKTESMSTLEHTVWQYLLNDEYDKDQLLNIAKTFYTWGALEQFYYIPILMTLIKGAIRGI